MVLNHVVHILEAQQITCNKRPCLEESTGFLIPGEFFHNGPVMLSFGVTIVIFQGVLAFQSIPIVTMSISSKIR